MKKEIPQKEALVNLYFSEHKSVEEIGKTFGTSRVTASKWFIYHNIELPDMRGQKNKKRTVQISVDDLKGAMEMFNNDKQKMADHFGIGTWAMREQLKSHDLYVDTRAQACKERTIEIPAKDILIDLYFTQNKNMTEVGELFGASNVTANKWFIHHSIKLPSHSTITITKSQPKSEITCLEKYGNSYFFGSLEGKEKVAETFMEKYGVPFHPIGNSSKAELEVLDYFNTLVSGFEKAHINKIELDGYNKELCIAFEYCGLFWHKESIKGKDLHEKKYKICKDAGIRLFTIFEDEWIKRKDQVKGFIKASLNVNNNKLFARKTTLEVLDKKDIEANDFMNKYHIQGAASKNTILEFHVLKYMGEIVSLMSIGRHHRNANEIVISRCCTKENLTIVGGSSKLFSSIKSKHTGILLKTWSDNRWTEGYLYERLGFTLEREQPKDYSYVTNTPDGRKSKQSMQKKNIGAREDQTEYERAIELGYDRIWDCGKKTWTIQL